MRVFASNVIKTAFASSECAVSESRAYGPQCCPGCWVMLVSVLLSVKVRLR